MQRTDVAVIGAGIVGLAHAMMAARQGHSVVLFERDRQAQGASVRNFGMIWPIGQTPGELYERAMRSREIWLEIAQEAGIWTDACGSLHLAYHADEAAVLQEFASQATALGIHCEMWTPALTIRECPAVRGEGLRVALWSPTELCVDPRQAISLLPKYLQEKYRVTLRFGTAVTSVEGGRLRTAGGETWQADRIVVCSGVDFETLFPDIFKASGIRRCKLQMMRTVAQPSGWRIGPHLAGGLTLCHYSSFRICSTLPVLQQRIQAEMPAIVRHGIHVMASQNHLGEVVIGDSHEYDADIAPFDKQLIDDLILGYLRTMVDLPNWTLGQRWHGLYAKHPEKPFFLAEPHPGVQIVNAPGGAGMTMSFGWADYLWRQWQN